MSMWIWLAGNIVLNEPIRMRVEFRGWTIHKIHLYLKLYQLPLGPFMVETLSQNFLNTYGNLKLVL